MEKDKTILVTRQIISTIFHLLEKNKEGLRWSELAKKAKESNNLFHPKTINGIIWKLTEKFPDKVYKPSRGVFKLLKYKDI